MSEDYIEAEILYIWPNEQKAAPKVRVSNSFGSFLLGLLVGVPTGVLAGVLLIAVLNSMK